MLLAMHMDWYTKVTLKGEGSTPGAEGSCAGACATCADAPVEKQDGSASQWEQAGPATAVVCGAMRMLPKSLSAGSSSKTLPHNIAGLDVACSKSSSAYTTRE
jgi:hypothetical protein